MRAPPAAGETRAPGRRQTRRTGRRGGTQQVYARGFDAAGRPLGPERRLSHTSAIGSIPSIQPWGRGFLVAWNEYRSAAGGGHGAIRFSRAVTARIE